MMQTNQHRAVVVRTSNPPSRTVSGVGFRPQPARGTRFCECLGKLIHIVQRLQTLAQSQLTPIA